MTALTCPRWGSTAASRTRRRSSPILRAPEGCPWDREQTHESLRRFLIEEAWEVLEAIEEGDAAALAEELGDLLLQIVLHAQIATEEGRFPHGRRAATYQCQDDPPPIRTSGATWTFRVTPEAVLHNWEELKRAEKAAVGKEDDYLLDSLPRGMPALLEALRLQERAAKVNFDWPHLAHVLDKVREEPGGTAGGADRRGTRAGAGRSAVYAG